MRNARLIRISRPLGIAMLLVVAALAAVLLAGPAAADKPPHSHGGKRTRAPQSG